MSGENNITLIQNDLQTLSNGNPGFVDIGFIGACRSLNSGIANYKMPCFIERKFTPDEILESDKLLLLFSDGKVSLATALMLREHHKDVTLFHVEESGALTFRVNEIAEKLKLPLVVSRSKFPGQYRKFFRGMNLVHTAFSYAMKNGYSPKIYMGCFEMASIWNNEQKDWCYCTEFIDAYISVVRKFNADADVVRMLPNYQIVDDVFIRYKDYLEFFAQPSEVEEKAE